MIPDDQDEHEVDTGPEIRKFEDELAELISKYRNKIKKNDMLDILESAHNSLEEDGEE